MLSTPRHQDDPAAHRVADRRTFPTNCIICRRPLVHPKTGRPRLLCGDPECRKQRLLNIAHQGFVEREERMKHLLTEALALITEQQKQRRAASGGA